MVDFCGDFYDDSSENFLAISNPAYEIITYFGNVKKHNQQ